MIKACLLHIHSQQIFLGNLLNCSEANFTLSEAQTFGLDSFIICKSASEMFTVNQICSI